MLACCFQHRIEIPGALSLTTESRWSFSLSLGPHGTALTLQTTHTTVPYLPALLSIIHNCSKHICPSHSVVDSDGLNAVLGEPAYSSHGAQHAPLRLYIHSFPCSSRHSLTLYLVRWTTLVSMLLHSHPVSYLRNTHRNFNRSHSHECRNVRFQSKPGSYRCASQGVMGVYLPLLQHMGLDDDFPSWQLSAWTMALNTISRSFTPSPSQQTSNNISPRSKPTVSEGTAVTIFSRVHPNVTSSGPGNRSKLTFAGFTLRS
ncbi:hypothetical protein JB92DRAFT_3060190 [Gautieria morchelliformis]|nr:hypothetical protein JB92DRAFT_3060190 [Gautieria morchelliformis]